MYLRVLFLIALLIFIGQESIAQSNYSQLSTGYHKIFPLDFPDNHVFFIAYAKPLKKWEKIWIGTRIDLQFDEGINADNGTFEGRQILAVYPDNNFALEGFIEHDPVNSGIKQLETMDETTTDISQHLTIGYKHKLKKIEIYLGLGAGATYKRSYSIGGVTLRNITLQEEGYPNTDMLLAFPRTERGFSPSIHSNLNISYKLTDVFSIGFDASYVNVASTILTQGISFNFKL